jgi:hypothetical protein
MITPAKWGDPEPGDLGRRECPILLSKALRVLAESGVTEDTLANGTGLAAAIVHEILRAADRSRPHVEVTLI